MPLNKIIYADNHATTEIDPTVANVMAQYLFNMGLHGNPSSMDHSHGMTAAIVLRRARNKLAEFINAESAENIIFTSGATESNNIILTRGNKDILPRLNSHILTSPFEHQSIRECAKLFDLWTQIPLMPDLTINFDELVRVVHASKIDLISCIGASGEIGTIFPIHEIGALCKSHKITFHCDATQLAPWAKIDVQMNNIDYLSISAHKLYGPKGVGMIYAKNPEKLLNLMYGGKQEFTKRPGTENILGILGFAKAVDLIISQRSEDSEKITLMRSKMEKIFRENFRNIDFRVNGGENRLPNNLSLTFYGLRPGLLELVNRYISVSSSSACHLGSAELSPTLKQLNHTEDSQTLRIGLGRFTTEEEGEKIAEIIVNAVNRLKEQ